MFVVKFVVFFDRLWQFVAKEYDAHFKYGS